MKKCTVRVYEVDPTNPRRRSRARSFEVMARGWDGLRSAARERLLRVDGLKIRGISITRDGEIIAYVERGSK